MSKNIMYGKYNGYHNVTYEQIMAYLTKSVNSGDITDEEKVLIEKFYRKKRSNKGGLSVTRMKKIAVHLVGWRKHYGIPDEYTKISIDDIEDAIFYIGQANSQTGKPFQPTTIKDYVAVLKDFMFFLIKSGNSEISPEDIRALKISLEAPMTKMAESIPTESEVTKIIECAKTTRDKALFHTMYDGGFRSCELGRLKWNQIKFDNLGALGGCPRIKCDQIKIDSFLI